MHGKRPLRQASVRVGGGVGVGWSEEGRVRRYIGAKDSLKQTVYSLSLFFYWRRVEAHTPVYDITFHTPHEHFLAQQLSS